MFSITVLLIVLLVIIIEHRKSNKSLKLHSMLGNDFYTLPIIGSLHVFFGSNEGRMEMFKKLAYYAYINKYRSASAWFGSYLVPIISDPEQAVAILKATNSKGHVASIAHRLIGNGLVFAPVKIWQPRRKILLPSFSSKHLAQFVFIFESQSKMIVEKLKYQVGKGNLSIWHYVSLYTLDSICETAFGINLKIQNKSNHTLFDALTQYLKNSSVVICQPLLHYDGIYNLLPISKTQKRLKQVIVDFIDNLICKKKKILSGELCNIEVLNGVEPSRVAIESFLESMIKSSHESGKKYTLEELREEVLTLAIAGGDTSATGTCFTATLLSQHADVQEKVYEEIIEVLGQERPIEMGDLHKLKYMDAVIKETLRLYPPVPLINRYMKQETQISSGIVLLERQNTVLNIWGLHHNPHHWGPDVEEFNPDRFISRPPPVAGAFIPFSTGPRNCIGYQYAMLSMKTALVTLLRNFRLKPATSFTYGKHNPLRISFDIMLRHIDNFEIQIEPRSYK